MESLICPLVGLLVYWLGQVLDPSQAGLGVRTRFIQNAQATVSTKKTALEIPIAEALRGGGPAMLLRHASVRNAMTPQNAKMPQRFLALVAPTYRIYPSNQRPPSTTIVAGIDFQSSNPSVGARPGASGMPRLLMKSRSQ